MWNFLTIILIKIYNIIFEKIETIKKFRFRLNDATFNEFRNLNHIFVIQTLNFEFIFNQTRSINKNINKNSIFDNKYFVDCSWRLRLQTFFTINDLNIKRRNWKTYDYRQFFRSLQYQICIRMKNVLATRFLNIIINQTIYIFFIIFRFEIDKFIVELKIVNVHESTRQQFFKSENWLRRIIWLMSQFSNVSFFAQQLLRHHFMTFLRCDSTIKIFSLFIYKKFRHDF